MVGWPPASRPPTSALLWIVADARRGGVLGDVHRAAADRQVAVGVDAAVLARPASSCPARPGRRWSTMRRQRGRAEDGFERDRGVVAAEAGRADRRSCWLPSVVASLFSSISVIAAALNVRPRRGSSSSKACTVKDTPCSVPSCSVAPGAGRPVTTPSTCARLPLSAVAGRVVVGPAEQVVDRGGRVQRAGVEVRDHHLDRRGQPGLGGGARLRRGVEVVGGHRLGLAADGQRGADTGGQDQQQDDPDQGHALLVAKARSIAGHMRLLRLQPDVRLEREGGALVHRRDAPSATGR